MDIINMVLGIPLGFAVHFAYQITNSYGLAIFIFATLVRIAVFPVNILTHRNSIKLLQMQPALNTIKRRYSGDKERLNEEQYHLFKKEKYSPYLSLIPLFLQLVIIMGVLQVMYNPMQHILRLDQGVIDAMISAGRELLGLQGGSGDQMRIIEALRQPENMQAFQTALTGFPDSAGILQQTAGMNLHFLGFNLGEVPSLAAPTAALIVPLMSGVSALVYCLTQSALSPGALSQSKRTGYVLTIVTIAFSLYFALVTPVGFGMYWTAANLLSTGVVLILFLLYNPKKLAGEALAQIIAARKTTSELREERKRKSALSVREKRDAARFQYAKKQLVFYALSGGQYKYYKNVIGYLLEHSDITVHYLTNDPVDSLFKMDNERLIPYYASQKKTISLMLKLDTDVFVTTVQGLQKYHLKRSVVRDDIEYIYMSHGMGSAHLAGRVDAIDCYDTIFCPGPHRVAEVRRREEMAGLPRKKLVKAGYGLHDQLAASYSRLPQIANGKTQVLIAPSWQEANILELCVDDILDALLGQGYIIIVRPHPQFTDMFPERMEALKSQYAEYTHEGELVFELDFSSNESLFMSDIVITDWSNIAIEFSFCTLKPSIFINTPMKIMNPDYEQFGLEAMEISLRDKIGVSVDLAEINSINKIITRLLNEKDAFKENIEQAMQQCLYHPGRSGEAGGKYIIAQLNAKISEES